MKYPCKTRETSTPQHMHTHRALIALVKAIKVPAVRSGVGKNYWQAKLHGPAFNKAHKARVKGTQHKFSIFLARA